MLLPLALATVPSAVPSYNAVASLVVLGPASTAGGFVLFYRLQADFGPGRASVVAYLAPGVAVLLGVAFRDEPFGLSTVAGLALILLGSRLAARSPGNRRAIRFPRPLRTARSTSGP